MNIRLKPAKMLLVVLVGVFLLVGATVNAAPKPRLEVWAVKSFIAPTNEMFEKQVRSFAKEKNIDVDVIFYTEAEMEQKFVAAIMAGAPPDVSTLYVDQVARFYDMGELMDVTDVTKEVAAAQGGWCAEAFLGPAFFENKYWAVPNASHTPFMYYRTDLFKKAGVAIPKTWYELRDAAKVITDPKAGVYGMGFTFNRSMDGEYNVMTIIWAFGGHVVAKDGKTVTLNSPQTLEAIKFMKSLYDLKLNPPGATGWIDPHNNEAWVAGQIASTINGGSIYWKLGSTNSKFRDVTMLSAFPAGPGGAANMAEARYYGVFKKTKYPQLAKDLIRYLMREDNYVEWLIASEGQEHPFTNNAAHRMREVWKSDPNLLASFDVMKTARFIGWPGPVTPAAAEVRATNVLTDMVSSVLVSGVSPETALKQATDRIKEIYSRYKK